MEWGISDHRLIWGTLKAETRGDGVRNVVDWDKLKDMVKGIKEGDIREEGKWYDGLPGCRSSLGTHRTIKHPQIQENSSLICVCVVRTTPGLSSLLQTHKPKPIHTVPKHPNPRPVGFSSRWRVPLCTQKLVSGPLASGLVCVHRCAPCVRPCHRYILNASIE